MELSFCDLRAKEVINMCDGRRLGNIIDLIFDVNYARITGIVVPYEKSFMNIFKGNQDIFIPWNRVCKIGKDVILVELTPSPLPFPPNIPSCPSRISPYTSTESNNDIIYQQNTANQHQNNNLKKQLVKTYT